MNIQQMINDYAEWLKNEIKVARTGEYYELTTPYLDRFNDYLQIYVKQEDDGSIKLTDYGYIIENLMTSGIPMREGSKRRLMMEQIIKTFSLSLDGDKIVTTADARNFPQKKHMMVQAMLAIDDMFEVSGENVKNFFIEDIETFFNAHEIYYSKDFSLIGKTGSLYKYEFHFQKTKTQPERFCKAINKVNESKRNLTIFNWIDTKEKRGDEGKLFVLMNDENEVSESDIDAFKTYDILPIKFSQRDKYLSYFVA